MTTSANGWDDLNQEFGSIDELTESFDDFEDIDFDAQPSSPIINKYSATKAEEQLKSDLFRETEARPVKYVNVKAEHRTDTHTRTYNPEEIRKYATKEETTPVSKPVKKEKTKKSSNTGLITGIIIGIVVLLLAGIVFLVAALLNNNDDPNTTDPSGNTTSSAEEVTTAAWDAGTAKIDELAENYYKARALVDVFTLTQLLDPSVQINEEQLAGESSVVSEYTDISSFVTDGMKEGEWVAYFFYSLRIKNIDTPIPGLEPVYILTDETGNLRIKTIEVVMEDEELNLFFANAANCDAVNELVDGVDAAYKLAISQDQKLYEFIKSIGGNVDPVEPATNPSDVPTTEAPTTEAPTTEAQPTTPASPTDFIECDTCMYITKNDVNMRKQPSTDADVIKSLQIGTYVQVMAKSTDWYKICDFENGGQVGYVSSQFFSDNKPSAN